MTPIKCFRVRGLEFYTEDYAGKRELICIALSPGKLEWLISAVRAFHSSVKDLKQWEED